MTSNYFGRDDRSAGRSHRADLYRRDQFRVELEDLAIKGYLVEYESAIRELLKLWLEKGRLLNLVYVSLVCDDDAGLTQLAADLELMLDAIQEYVHKNVYLLDRKRPADPAITLERVRSTHAALQDKLAILREAETYRTRLETACGSTIIGRRLLRQAPHLPTDCCFFVIAEQLAQWLVRYATALTQDATTLPIFEEAFLGRAAHELSRLAEGVAVTSGVPTPRWPHSSGRDRALAVCAFLDERITCWLRALVNSYDQPFFQRHRQGLSNVAWTNAVIACFDIAGSTPYVDAAQAEEEVVSARRVDQWRSMLGAAPRNWTIALGGAIGSSKGDAEIGYFKEPRAAVDAMTLALAQIDLLSALRHQRGEGGVSLTAGVGEGLAMLAADQELAPAINHFFHAAKKVPGSRTEAEQGWQKSRAILLEGFALKYDWTKEFSRGKQYVEFEEGRAVLVDYNQLLSSFLARFCSSAGPS